MNDSPTRSEVLKLLRSRMTKQFVQVSQVKVREVSDDLWKVDVNYHGLKVSGVGTHLDSLMDDMERKLHEMAEGLSKLASEVRHATP